MKLCFVGDPQSIHTQRWVRWFAADHDVTVVCTSDSDTLADLRACTLPTRAIVPGIRFVRSVIELRRVLGTIRPDVLHAHYINESGWFGAMAGQRPFVLSAWGSDVYRAPVESRLARRLNPWAARRADLVVCDSRDQARVLRKWGAREVEVVGWGVDRSEFHPDVDGSGVRECLGIPPDASVVLSPRQWLPNSNIPAVVRAHSAMPEDCFLVLKRQPRFERGHGRAVEAAIAASAARGRIRVVGEVPAATLPALYGAADVIVSLCITDGTPVSVLEAMACGRPVLAQRNAGVAEWISEPGGLLVDELDPTELAASLVILLAPAARRAAAAHNVRVVAARADRGTEMTRMLERYEHLIARS